MEKENIKRIKDSIKYTKKQFYSDLINADCCTDTFENMEMSDMEDANYQYGWYKALEWILDLINEDKMKKIL